MLLEANPIDFDMLGEEASSRFFNQAEPLEDVVVKMAQEHKLNPEEVKRLVEKANTFSSVKFIKAASDKTTEFELADYQATLQRTHPEGSQVEAAVVKEAACRPEDMPRTVKDASTALADSHAFFKSATEKTASAPADKKPLSRVFKLQQAIAKLGREKTAAELRFKKTTDQLISNFSNLYGPDFNKFASEAYTLFAEPGKVLIDGLANALRESPALKKVAYIVDDVTDKELGLFKTAMDAVHEVRKTRADLEKTKQKLDEAWEKAKGRR